MLRIRATPCSFCLQRLHPGAPETHLALGVSGEIAGLAGGETRRLSPGAFWLSDNLQPILYTFNSVSEIAFILVQSDFFSIHTGFPAADFNGCFFPGSTPLQRFFGRSARSIALEASLLPAEAVPNLFDGILCLLRPALREAAQARPAPPSRRGSPDFWRKKALDWMQANLINPRISAKSAAEAVGISPRYLTVVFRQAGTTPMRSLLEMRLRRASIMLLEPHCAEKTIAEVSRRCGFASAAHFSRAFRAMFGTTPLGWRKKGRYSNPE